MPENHGWRWPQLRCPQRVLPIVLALGALAMPATAKAQPIRTAKGALLSCPDPSVVDAQVGRYRYYLACTSDYAANAYPIRGSNDLLHWHFIAYVFPARHQPSWAVHSPVGHYWAPALYRINGHWVVYFAAQYNPAAINLRFPHGASVPSGTFAIGVATANSIRGPWHSRLLHFRGQYNGMAAEREDYGGVIDPSMVQDPETGQRYLFWAEQHSSIWAATLSSDGLTLDPHVHQVLWANSGWACNTPSKGCTVEGPEETYQNGRFYLFYSGASTWSGSYAVGAAVSSNPLVGQFTPIGPTPILRSGNGWLGPGGSSAPVTGPDGHQYILYHAMPRPDNQRISANRYLFIGQVTWGGPDGTDPLINGGLAG